VWCEGGDEVWCEGGDGVSHFEAKMSSIHPQASNDLGLWFKFRSLVYPSVFECKISAMNLTECENTTLLLFGYQSF
jgi:hypothetical protein